ncbi:MAG: hypothetical protein Q9204_006453 [Flavoplaca sp. TL-2023a]
MKTLFSLLMLTVFTIDAYSSLGTDLLANESYPQLEPRQDIPEVPPKPPTSGPGSFHGSQFQFLKQTDFAPAVDAMPVWVYSRTQKEFSPCAPEGGTDTTGKGPNPGTNVPPSASPGEDCMDVGPDPSGPYTLANAFPTYVGAVYCDDSDEWRIQYYNYYVYAPLITSFVRCGLARQPLTLASHDGVMSFLGHVHDWEGIVVKWQRDAEGDNWWHRSGAIYNKHCFHDHYEWDQLNTVDVDVGSDVSNEATGLNRKHPKVYVGFFSHASFPEIYKSRKTHLNADCPELRDLLGNEYRSNDWWRLPRREDIRPASDIDPDWDYGDATSNPGTNFENICKW